MKNIQVELSKNNEGVILFCDKIILKDNKVIMVNYESNFVEKHKEIETNDLGYIYENVFYSSLNYKETKYYVNNDDDDYDEYEEYQEWNT